MAMRNGGPSPLPLREGVDCLQRETGEGFFSAPNAPAAASQTPHPPLRGTFSLKGRREDGVRPYGNA